MLLLLIFSRKKSRDHGIEPQQHFINCPETNISASIILAEK